MSSALLVHWSVAVAVELGGRLFGAVVVDQGFAVGRSGDRRGDGDVVEAHVAGHCWLCVTERRRRQRSVGLCGPPAPGGGADTSPTRRDPSAAAGSARRWVGPGQR